MKINHLREKNLVRLEIVYEEAGEVRIVERLFYEILSECFLHRFVTVVTISPQKYSLAHELASPVQMTIGRSKLLVNEISDCTADELKLISESEEFARGLLVVIQGNSENVGDIIEEFLSERTVNNGVNTVVLSVDDGNTLLIYNGDFTISQIENMERKAHRL